MDEADLPVGDYYKSKSSIDYTTDRACELGKHVQLLYYSALLKVVDMTTRTRKSDVYIILANRTPLHYHTSQDLSNLRVLCLTFPE